MWAKQSRFSDVRGDSYVYKAIAVSVERGIMSADRTTGRFRPEDTVMGVELSPFWTCTAINSLTNMTDDLG
ncbi:MAG: S-layer homology domain-containing protein [Candidatus Latescibacterota bacterium]|nr:S-layer homology domain-containing protein [Candidatus Latescibacterota bacterium]